MEGISDEMVSSRITKVGKSCPFTIKENATERRVNAIHPRKWELLTSSLQKNLSIENERAVKTTSVGGTKDVAANLKNPTSSTHRAIF